MERKTNTNYKNIYYMSNNFRSKNYMLQFLEQTPKCNKEM